VPHQFTSKVLVFATFLKVNMIGLFEARISHLLVTGILNFRFIALAREVSFWKICVGLGALSILAWLPNLAF